MTLADTAAVIALDRAGRYACGAVAAAVGRAPAPDGCCPVPCGRQPRRCCPLYHWPGGIVTAARIAGDETGETAETAAAAVSALADLTIAVILTGGASPAARAAVIGAAGARSVGLLVALGACSGDPDGAAAGAVRHVRQALTLLDAADPVRS